jgi:hypothetical protein
LNQIREIRKRKVKSQRQPQRIAQKKNASFMVFASIGFSVCLVGCGGKTAPPFGELVPSSTSTVVGEDLTKYPTIDPTRLAGATPYSSPVAGPFSVAGKDHYYQAVRYNTARNKSKLHPNGLEAKILALASKYTTPSGTVLKGHAATITSAEERNFIVEKLGNVSVEKSDFVNDKDASQGLRSSIRGLVLGASINIASNPTRGIAKDVLWVTGESSDYENWTRDLGGQRSEPGGSNTENYLQINSVGSPKNLVNTDGWNDYNGEENQTNGYLVEFE